MRKGALSLKVKGKDTINFYMTRITYTEAVGELDGLTATFTVPPNKEKDLKPLMEPGLPFEIELLDGKGKISKTLNCEDIFFKNVDKKK